MKVADVQYSIEIGQRCKSKQFCSATKYKSRTLIFDCLVEEIPKNSDRCDAASVVAELYSPEEL